MNLVRKTTFLLLFGGLLSLAALQAQPTAESIIAGRVVDLGSGEPIPRALVLIVRFELPGPAPKIMSKSTLLADDKGAFQFDKLPAGNYALATRKPGFENEPGHPVTLVPGVAGPMRKEATLRMRALGAIEGVVRNDRGQPMTSVVVQLIEEWYHFGFREFNLSSREVTDDRGHYRFQDLSSSRYYVRAAGYDPEGFVDYRGERAPAAPLEEVFLPVYNGGARTLATVNPIALTPGQEASVDLTLNLTSSSHTIRGAIANAKFVEEGKYELTVDGEFTTNGRRLALNRDKGLFEIRYAAPGTYRLRLIKGETVGEATVTVKDSDVESVVVQLQPVVSLKGRVALASTEDKSKGLAMPTAILERLENNHPSFSFVFDNYFNIEPGKDGVFKIDRVPPGEYVLRANTSQSYIDSAFAGDTDLLHHPLTIGGASEPPPIEITLKSDGGTVDGDVKIENLPDTAFVSLLPDSLEPIQAVANITNGRFSASGLKPGEYNVCVFPHGIGWQDADVRRALKGVRVRVEANGHQTVHLTELAQ